MKEKGFTLIELLAVIVILAIIALIATPIILNIIEDSKNSADLRSKEMYLHGVELALANKNVTENFEPTTCTVKSDGNLTCDVGDLLVETKGSKPKEGGTITFKDGKITGNTLEFSDSVNVDEPKGSMIKPVTEENKTLAGNIPQGNYEPGDEYIVNVDGTHEYHFYVLSTEGDKVNLIMSKNICSDGTLTTDENPCLVAWYSPSESSTYGPVTAMNYIYEATKNWSSIPNIELEYIDERYAGSIYGGITTNGSTTTITMKDGTPTSSYENLKARMPKFSEIDSTGCGITPGSCPSWMVNGLESYIDLYPLGTKEDIPDIGGYWSLSSSDPTGASGVNYYGYSGRSNVNNRGWNNGIRPVIEISKSELQ